MMAAEESPQLDEALKLNARRPSRLGCNYSPWLRQGVAHHADRRRPAWRYPPAEPGAVRALELVRPVRGVGRPVIHPPGTTFGFVEFGARQLQVDVTMLAAVGISDEQFHPNQSSASLEDGI